MTLALNAIAQAPVVGPLTVEALLILVALLGAIAFVISYPVLADLRRWSREGWHMWLFTLALCSLGGSSITRRIWPESADHPAYTVAILATYSLLAVLMWQRCWLLWTARRYDQILHERQTRRGRRELHHDPTPPTT